MSKKILYVEDNTDTANAVKIILSKEGFEVDIANCGQECFIKISKNPFDLIMLDIMLPDMSGWEIFNNLKTKIATKYAFMSAIPVSTERVVQLKNEGVCDYIMKPFSKKDLVNRINKILIKE